MEKKEMTIKRNGFWKISVFALLFAVLAFISIGCASADTIYVPEGGNQTIQQAVDNATEGDTIYVHAGEYVEHVVISKDNISVIGQDAENTIINSGGSGVAVLLNSTKNVTVSNFTLLNDPASWFAEVVYNYSKLVPAAYDSPLPANYSLVLISVDAKASPRQGWLQLSNESGILGELVVCAGETFELVYGPNNTTILNATVESIFAGSTAGYIILSHTHLYDDGVTVLSDARLVLVAGGDAPVLYTDGGVDWQLEEGYTLTVGDVDAKACPRQMWLRLSKDDVVLDEQVFSCGDLYSYYKNGSLVLNATADGMFSSGGLWAASFSQINQYNETTHNLLLNESFYLFKNADVSGKNNWSLHENYSLSVIGIDAEATPRLVWLQLSKNDVPVDDKILCGWDYYNYSKNGSLVITSKVRDVFDGFESTLVTLDSVYQYNETTHSELINNTSHSYLAGNLKGVDWQLKEGYTLTVGDVDAEASPRQVWLRLSKDDVVLDEQILSWGNLYSYYKNGSLVLNATSNGIFSSGGLWAASFSQINQYNETIHNLLLNESFYLFKNADVSGKNNWSLHENYSLSVIGIDAEASPRQVWLQLSKNNVPVDDKILCGWYYYNYSKNGSLVITSKVRDVFKGYESALVTLDNVYQYSETTHSELMNNASHAYSTGNLKGVNWSLHENYSLSVIGIDAEASPRQMWLRLSKDDVVLDEQILSWGNLYSYYKNGQLIFTAYMDSIFAGVTTDMIQFKQVRQYSESGTLLMETNKKTLVVSSPTQSGYNKGVLLYNSHENKISNNLIKSHFCGIGATDSSNNTLTGNTASNNDYGIKLEDSSGNTIYLNNLINNTNNAYDTSSNQWNTSSKGNYYSDYTGSDNNSDGIGDDPHSIPGGSSVDYFPLMMYPWEEPPLLKGDLDGDFQITSTDAAIVLEIAVGSRSCDSKILAIADVSGDGRISSLDALMILQAAAGDLIL